MLQVDIYIHHPKELLKATNLCMILPQKADTKTCPITNEFPEQQNRQTSSEKETLNTTIHPQTTQNSLHTTKATR